jgi:glutaredoxin-like protein DUF836
VAGIAQPAGHRVAVMSRASCPACREVEAEVDRICGDVGEHWVAVDVDTDPELGNRYGDRVPVVLVDGVEIGFWTVPEADLRAALARG